MYENLTGGIDSKCVLIVYVLHEHTYMRQICDTNLKAEVSIRTTIHLVYNNDNLTSV